MDHTMPILAALTEANNALLQNLRATWRQYRLTKLKHRNDLRPIIRKRIRAIRTLREHAMEINHPIHRWKELAEHMRS